MSSGIAARSGLNGARGSVRLPLATILLFALAGCTWINQWDEDRRLDPDGDGILTPDDCDDADPNAGDAPLRWPGAEELCDGIDNDCDGLVDEEVATVLIWPDADGDGYGVGGPTLGCEAPTGSATTGGDCDDTDSQINPGAKETCNEQDDDCDDLVDELPPVYTDADRDGHGDPDQPVDVCHPEGSASPEADDCDDTDATIYPSAPELCDGLDNDCDGADEIEYFYTDEDGDGDGVPGSYHTECPVPANRATTGSDCDDTDPTRNGLLLEDCSNGIDDDCDGFVDWGVWHRDGDGDGDGAATGREFCTPPVGYVQNDWDCDDSSLAEPIFVDGGAGSDTNAGSSGAPLATLAAALAGSPGCVVVQAGTYEGPFTLGDFDTSILAADGALATTLTAVSGTCTSDDTSGCVSVVRMAGTGTVELEGFTLTGGSGTAIADPLLAADTTVVCGGGVAVESGTLALFDVTITTNSLVEGTAQGVLPAVQSAGGALCVVGGTLEWTGGWAVGNDAQLGGALAAYGGSVALEQVAFAENSAERGGAIWMAEPTFAATQVRAWCNDATEAGGAFYLASLATTATLSYVDLALDSAPDGAEAGGVAGSVLTLDGLAAYGDAANTLFDTAGSVVVGASVVWNASGEVYGDGATAGSSVLLADPRFTAVTCNGIATDDDFTLQVSSPALDAGPTGETDTDGSLADAGSNGGSGGAW